MKYLDFIFDFLSASSKPVDRYFPLYLQVGDLIAKNREKIKNGEKADNLVILVESFDPSIYADYVSARDCEFFSFHESQGVVFSQLDSSNGSAWLANLVETRLFKEDVQSDFQVFVVFCRKLQDVLEVAEIVSVNEWASVHFLSVFPETAV